MKWLMGWRRASTAVAPLPMFGEGVVGEMPMPGRSRHQRRTYGTLMPPRRPGLRLGGSAASSVIAYSSPVGGIMLGGSGFGG